MEFFKEFKDFIAKGNVIDMAIGIIIGSAFGKIITSLVEDVLTPAILNPALKAIKADNLSQLVIPGTAIKYGNFISSLISFIVIALCLFVIIKAINKLKKDEQKPEVPSTPSQEQLLTEIRDLLKK